MAHATAQVVYDAARELMTGAIGKRAPFHLIAYSGGYDGERRRVNQAVKFFEGRSFSMRRTPRLDAGRIGRAGHLVAVAAKYIMAALAVANLFEVLFQLPSSVLPAEPPRP